MIHEKRVSIQCLARHVLLEVTERDLLMCLNDFRLFRRFRRAGYEVAIDDFGTGLNLQSQNFTNADLKN